MKSNDKIPFNTFLKSEQCLQDDLPRSQGVFKDAEPKGKDFSFIILAAVALLSIVLCVFYFKDGYTEVNYDFTVSGNSILEVSSMASSEANSEVSSQASSKVPASDEDKININTADIEKLCEIKYIGKAKALNIISYRMANGNFESIDEIKNVKGIGDATFEKIKDSICI